MSVIRFFCIPFPFRFRKRRHFGCVSLTTHTRCTVRTDAPLRDNWTIDRVCNCKEFPLCICSWVLRQFGMAKTPKTGEEPTPRCHITTTSTCGDWTGAISPPCSASRWATQPLDDFAPLEHHHTCVSTPTCTLFPVLLLGRRQPVRRRAAAGVEPMRVSAGTPTELATEKVFYAHPQVAGPHGRVGRPAQVCEGAGELCDGCGLRGVDAARRTRRREANKQQTGNETSPQEARRNGPAAIPLHQTPVPQG